MYHVIIAIEYKYDILDDPREIYTHEDEMHIRVTQTPIEENYVGTSRGEDYYETNSGDTEMFTVKLPLEYMYDEQNPDDHLEKYEAREKIKQTNWSLIEAQDIETAKFSTKEKTFIASFDCAGLMKYMQI